MAARGIQYATERAIMKIAYFDCFAGAAGDMIVAAMIDAGLGEDFLAGQLATLGIDSLKIEVAEVQRCGIRAAAFTPSADEGHVHRNIKDITAIIENSGVSAAVKVRAVAIFANLAKVEGRIHGKDESEIHFHEVGAIDSIADIVSACIGFEALGIERVYCSTVSVGSGTVKCAHGTLPVPAPATAELVKEANIPVSAGPGGGELLTPTAAAILGSYVDQFGTIPPMVIERIGHGAGTRDSDEFANVLRLMIGESAECDGSESDTVCLLEANIDDATGEQIGFAMEMLFAEGALDVFTEPIQMKKNRPGVRLSVMCKPDDAGKMEDVIFGQGLSFGLRKQFIERSKLARQMVTVDTEYGQIAVKVGSLRGKEVTAKPEYEDCAKAAKKHGVALKTVQKAAMRTLKKS